MNRTRYVTRLLLCAGFLKAITCPTVSDAESILIAQLYHSTVWARELPDEPFRFTFFAAIGPEPENKVELLKIPTLADIGQTFSADPATLSKFEYILTSSTVSASIQSGLGQPVRFNSNVQEFFDGPFMGQIPPTHSPDNPAFVMKAFVPQLGLNFSGYSLTRLDQTVHGFSVGQTNPGGFYGYWGAHTINIYGERIPEPTTSVLAGVLLVCLAGYKKRLFAGLPDNRD